MKIIDTGRHLPKAKHTHLFKLWQNRKQLVVKPVKQLSRKQGDVIYGRHAVNKLTGVERHTYDYDVYSSHAKNHAIKIEKSIDQGTNSNLAYVKPMTYNIDGNDKVVYRVKTRPHGQSECDYQAKPKGLKYNTIGGVHYETLDRAEKKYTGMIQRNETHRFPNAFFDKYDTTMYKRRKK